MSQKASDAENYEAVTNADFLYEHAPCGHLSFLADGQILRVNGTFCKWLGRSSEELCQLKFTSLLSRGGAIYYQMFVNPLLSLHGIANEINFSLSSGNVSLDVLFNAVAYKNDQGKLTIINASFQKITDRKKYEAELLLAKRNAEEEKRRFEFLSNTVPNLIWTALPDGRINFINQKVKDYFNLMDATGNVNFNRIVKEDRKSVIAAWKKSIKTGKKLYKEVRFQGKELNPEWFLMLMEPYHNEQGEIELWFGSSTNIHKKKLLQLANFSSLSESLNTAQKTIDQNIEAFFNIAMNHSHMIRKPLANLLGLIPLLNDELVTKEGQYVLKLIIESAQELDENIKQGGHQIKP